MFFVFLSFVWFFGALACKHTHAHFSAFVFVWLIFILKQNRKAALGDEVAKYELDQKIQKQKEKETDRSSKGIAMRIVQFAERTTDQFLENLASLATAIFANVIAIALNTTVKDTFEWIINNQDLTIALYWLFSMIVTLIACYVALKTGAAMDKAEIELYDFVYKTAQEQNIKKKSDIWTNEHVDQTVIKFAARRRFVNLINYTLGLTMAWSWRDALKYTIINAYGGDTDSETLSGLWIYVLFASLMVGFVNSLAEKYYFLYPKDADSGLQLESKERKFIGNAIYKNAQCVVGIAWHDALVESSDVICSGWTNVAVLWVIFITFQVLYTPLLCFCLFLFCDLYVFCCFACVFFFASICFDLCFFLLAYLYTSLHQF